VELMVRSDPLQPFSWWVNFTRARVEDTIAGTDVPRAWDQRRALGAGLLWRWERWEWSLAGSYRSGWPTTAVALAEFGEPSLAAVGPRNAEQLGNYLALDTRLARDFRFSGGDSLTVFLEVTNLTDRVNQCCVEYEINDDIGEPQLETQRVDSLRIVPLLGFTWRF
jgi:hypothetical protein